MFNSTRPLFSPSSIHFFINFSNIFLSPLHLLASFLLSPSYSFLLTFFFPLCTFQRPCPSLRPLFTLLLLLLLLPPPSWPHQREQRKSLRELKMWLDQLERDAIQAQETEGNLTQQYQVCMCVCVCLGTCALQTGHSVHRQSYYQLNQWHYTVGIRQQPFIFSVNLAYSTRPSGYFPYSKACGISPCTLHNIEKNRRMRGQRKGKNDQ